MIKLIKYKNYEFSPDTYGGWILYENKKSKKNTFYKSIICYPNDFKGCLIKIYNLMQKDEFSKKDYELSEAIKKLSELQKEIKEFLKNYNKEI